MITPLFSFISMIISVLSITKGLRQGDGTPDNPYVFVEMGPDSMTVNSISAEVVTTDENGVQTTHTSETDSTGMLCIITRW
jgi:hypothetical protein